MAVGWGLRWDSWPEYLHAVSRYVLSFVITWHLQCSYVVAQGIKYKCPKRTGRKLMTCALRIRKASLPPYPIGHPRTKVNPHSRREDRDPTSQRKGPHRICKQSLSLHRKNLLFHEKTIAYELYYELN